MSPVFLVCTGRCGSSLVSGFLHAHPEVLSLSGFFSMLEGRAFPADPLDGREFWRLVSARRTDIEHLLRSGGQVVEYKYPYHRGRFNLKTGIPALFYRTLPLLTDDPEGLYFELEAAIGPWPRRPVAEHYRHLFRWLADRLDRSVVVERSGQSTLWIPQLRATFPDARFVHLYRNGPDCALSISNTSVLRMLILQAEAARLAGAPHAGAISPEQLNGLPGNLARIATGDYDLAHSMSDQFPVTWFGQVWSEQVCAAVAELAELPPSRRMSLSYEDMVRNPATELTRLARFIGVEPTPTWLQHTVAQFDTSRAGAASRLDPTTRVQLEQACAAGTEALRSAS